MVCERYAYAVGTQIPIRRCGGGFEVGEESDGAFEGGEFAGGYRVEAGVVESTIVTLTIAHDEG
jgi:hypothetical protein